MRAVVFFLLGLALWSLPGFPAALEAETTAQPLLSIDTGEDLPVVAAWSPDGRRLAYGTEKEVARRRAPLSAREGPAISYPGEVWVKEVESEDKPKRVLKHDFLRTREGDFFSFSVERLAWSPDGEKLLAELTDERKNTATFLFTAEGKEIRLGSSRVNFVAGYGGGWLADNESLGLLTEAVSPRLLHRVSLVRVAAGRRIALFTEKTFAAVAWLPHANKAVLIERDRAFARLPRLVVGDLGSGELDLLDELSDGYLGGLQASPDETRVSYFVGQEKLAVRKLEPNAGVEYWPIPFGRYEWAGPQAAVLFIEPQELGRRSGWLTLYDREQDRKQHVLPDELIQDFWVSSDGRQVAVLTAGLKPTLKVYRLEAAGGSSKADSSPACLRLPDGSQARQGRQAPLGMTCSGAMASAEALRVFLEQTAVHHHLKASSASPSRGFLVNHAFLHPDYPGADANGAGYNGGERTRSDGTRPRCPL